MTQASGLAYSNDACSAFTAAIVDSFQRSIGERHYLGRTAVQKLVYFAKALGVPIPCSFEIYTYGPYSDTVTFAVDSMLADDVLKDVSGGSSVYSNYRLGNNASEILASYSSLLDPYRSAIDAVVNSLGKFKPSELELVATLHFIHNRLKQILRLDPSKDQVLSEFRRVKKDKFTETEIDTFYNALKDANLI